MRLTSVLLVTLVAACDTQTVGGGGDEDAGTVIRPDAEIIGETPDAGAAATPDATPEVEVKPVFKSCTGREWVDHAAGDFNHWDNQAAAAAGDPNHSAQDEIVPTNSDATLTAKLTYGFASYDISDDFVKVYLDDCDGWRHVADVMSDGDGFASYTFTDKLAPGAYDVRFEVVGDGSTAPATLWVLPAGTHLMVTDIDGTLTTGDSELIYDLAYDLWVGDYVPEAYPSAAALTHAHDAKDHIVVYMTGRPYYLIERTRQWLVDKEMARGPLRLAASNSEAMPTEGGVGSYKLAYLETLTDKGFLVDLAYGNATTDIYAYLNLPLPAERVWIIGSNAGEQSTHAVTESWQARTAEVQAQPAVVQPFTR
jgi:phosphatidate phosphatase PAH1